MRPFTAAILISIANLLAWLSLLYHSRNFRWKWTPMEGYLSSIGTWTSETDIVVGNASGNEYLGMISIKKLETRRIIANWNICRSLIGIWIMSRYKCKSLCKSKGVWTTLCMNLSLIISPLLIYRQSLTMEKVKRVCAWMKKWTPSN